MPPQTPDCSVMCYLLCHFVPATLHSTGAVLLSPSGAGRRLELLSKSPCFHIGDVQSNTGHPKEKTDQITHPVNAMPKQKPKR